MVRLFICILVTLFAYEPSLGDKSFEGEGLFSDSPCVRKSLQSNNPLTSDQVSHYVNVHVACAHSCFRRGESAAFITKDGEAFLDVKFDTKELESKLNEFLGHFVFVKGSLIESEDASKHRVIHLKLSEVTIK